eukprot:GHVQ01019240.1.p1 GENE.GHVQ01019240.1~~GHVQ01019240.1.p1  ORF type:complete len:629 (+),score=43.52 GHVQ01019240.1:1885-3771(+)
MARTNASLCSVLLCTSVSAQVVFACYLLYVFRTPATSPSLFTEFDRDSGRTSGTGSDMTSGNTVPRYSTSQSDALIHFLPLLSSRFLPSYTVQFRIVVNHYNTPEQLSLCLLSLQSQSYKHFTACIVDDFSHPLFSGTINQRVSSASSMRDSAASAHQADTSRDSLHQSFSFSAELSRNANHSTARLPYIDEYPLNSFSTESRSFTTVRHLQQAFQHDRRFMFHYNSANLGLLNSFYIGVYDCLDLSSPKNDGDVLVWVDGDDFLFGSDVLLKLAYIYAQTEQRTGLDDVIGGNNTEVNDETAENVGSMKTGRYGASTLQPKHNVGVERYLQGSNGASNLRHPQATNGTAFERSIEPPVLNSQSSVLQNGRAAMPPTIPTVAPRAHRTHYSKIDVTFGSYTSLWSLRNLKFLPTSSRNQVRTKMSGRSSSVLSSIPEMASYSSGNNASQASTSEPIVNSRALRSDHHGTGSCCPCHQQRWGHIHRNSLYRNVPWMFSHLKTFRFYLFNKIDVETACKRNGRWLLSASDHAIMYPVLEMSGGRAQCISDTLYYYNVKNSLSHHNRPRSRRHTGVARTKMATDSWDTDGSRGGLNGDDTIDDSDSFTQEDNAKYVRALSKYAVVPPLGLY